MSENGINDVNGRDWQLRKSFQYSSPADPLYTIRADCADPRYFSQTPKYITYIMHCRVTNISTFRNMTGVPYHDAVSLLDILVYALLCRLVTYLKLLTYLLTYLLTDERVLKCNACGVTEDPLPE